MEEEAKNSDKRIDKLIYSPKRRRTSKKRMLAFLDGLGRKQSSDKNALKFVDNELKRKATLTAFAHPKEFEIYLESNYYLIILLCITIFILINEEIKSLFTQKSADLPFSIIVIIFMLFYISDLIANSILVKDYFLNFYFWLDIIGIISTLLDIHWFYNSIIELIGGKLNSIEDLLKRKDSKIFITIKVFRIIRIIRIIRITKLYIIIEKVLLKLKREKEKRDIEQYQLEEKKRKEEEEENKKKSRKFMEEYIHNALSKISVPKENMPSFFVNIMKRAMKKAKEKNMNPTSPKKLVNIIAKNIGINFDNINQENKKKENNKENKSDHSKESKEYSLIENKQTIEINIEDNKEENNLYKHLSSHNIDYNNKDEFNFFKKTILNNENEENKGNNIKMQISKNINKEEKKLSEILLNKTKQKVIILVLYELFCFALLNPSNYITKITNLEIGFNFLCTFTSNKDTDFLFYYNLYIEKHKNITTPIIFLKIGDLEYGNFEDVINLREQEKLSYSDKCNDFNIENNNKINNCIAIFNYQYINRLKALVNLIKTIVSCIFLYFSNYWFSSQLSKMILDPTDAMVERVKIISENPLQIIHDEEQKALVKVIEDEEKKKEKEQVVCGCSSKNNSKTEMISETEILEKTISKIGALLALSLGDAGTEIISQNMKENSTGEINPMIPGKKICAIYGFCDVRNFTGLTEILQEKVMVFVNDIADIVHQYAFEYGGSANKNVGDAFLLVWKFDNKFTYISKKNNELKVYNCEQVNQICDMALISILKMFAGIEKSKEINKFKNLDEIINKFGDNAIKIGFGISLGWSIEGAIGSNFKIDASYLSPNCNMANTCEEKTKIYGVNLIMTDKFVENLSNEAQKKTRILDIYYGENETIGFYTMDFDTSELLNDDEFLDI